MLALQIKEKEILLNFIAMFNLIEKELKELLGEMELNYLEFSVLVYISKNEASQYRIAKKYKISLQRTHQIVKKLLESGYIDAREEKKNGRITKKLFLTKNIEEIGKVNDGIIKICKNKKISSKNLKDFNRLLMLFINQLDPIDYKD